MSDKSTVSVIPFSTGIPDFVVRLRADTSEVGDGSNVDAVWRISTLAGR